jgi:hypothetical protein
MNGLGEIAPILSLSSGAERAALRAERAFQRRERRYGRKAHLDFDDGLVLTPDGADRLAGCHRARYVATDWRVLAERPEIVVPPCSKRREKAARRLLAEYEPSWQHRMFAEEANRRRELTDQVLAAAHADALEHRNAVQAAAEHNAQTARARRVMAFDTETLQELVAQGPLSSLHDSLNSVGLARPAADRVVAVLDLIQEDDVPTEQITSRNPTAARRELIADSDRRRLHLSAVCAAALRVAGELVGLLPVERLEMVAACETSGVLGASVRTPILQFRLSRDMVERMAWDADPVTLVRSLGPRMHWTMDEGFAPVPLWQGNAAPMARRA